MAKMEMYSLRVSRDQKRAWDAYAEQLGTDTSLFVRTVVDTAVRLSPTEFALWIEADARADDRQG